MYWLLIAIGVVFMSDALHHLREKDSVSFGCDMVMVLIAEFLAAREVGVL